MNKAQAKLINKKFWYLATTNSNDYIHYGWSFSRQDAVQEKRRLKQEGIKTTITMAKLWSIGAIPTGDYIGI